MVLLFVLAVLVVLLIVWIISLQNKLVSINEFCNNSLSQISVQQQSR